jgi:hypothetical protein
LSECRSTAIDAAVGTSSRRSSRRFEAMTAVL